MAISPVADIVLEVARAANPAGYRAAEARLRDLASTDPSRAASFAETSRSLSRRSEPAPHLPFDPARALVDLRSGEALTARRADPYERFEAFVLQTFVQSMLPKGDSALFGSGTAGEMWKSMLAEGIGTQLARSGGIGIADMLSARQALDGTEDRSTASAANTRHRKADT